ncbi:MAG: MurR/RpiR family transcriptional regulator [Rhizobiaceae bacterium]
MDESISERISNTIDQLPERERRAAQALVSDYPLAGLRTVADFATRAGVSSPTILRFVAKLGFQNYAEFQSALQIEVVQQLQSPLARAEKKPLANGDNDAEPYVDAIIENVRETFRHISNTDFNKLAALIADGKRVYLIGGRFTDAVARYMTSHLRLIRNDVQHVVGQEANWRDHLVEMGRKDVLLVFDIRRYQDSLLEFSTAAASGGTSVILFTDQWLSPIARVARHVVTARTTVPSAWDSNTALFALVEALTARVTARLGDKAAWRIAEVERLRGTKT